MRLSIQILSNFNSTMVRLKATDADVTIAAVADFNSTMVRLKARAEPPSGGAARFQFHYGTIKSRQSENHQSN